VIGTLAGTIRRLALFVGLLFVALMVNLNLVQVTRADDLANRPGNNRSVIKEYAKERGPILVGSSPVARSVATNDRLKFQRTYANGPLYAPATGYYSLIYGRSGIEKAEDAVLSGTDPRFSLQQLADLVAGRSTKGGQVGLTLDAKAQAAAAQAMGTKVGAVVAIEPSTGRILALVQNPSFDPNLLASNDASVERDAWIRYLNDPRNPMLNRPLAEVYPPGSTFKLVTLAAALSTGLFNAQSKVPGPAALPLPGTTVSIRNENGRPCATNPDGTTTLLHALEVSCNTAFAWLGIKVGADALQAQAEAFGFNHQFQVPMTAATSRFPTDLNVPQTAQSAIGQYDVRATALQMAMVGAALAYNGTVRNPYLVDARFAPDTTLLEQRQPTTFGQAVTPSVALQITDMMVSVVEDGTGQNAQIPGVRVAGKTGTAQTGNDKPADAWFVSFAPALAVSGSRQVAVAVVVEGAPNNGEISGGGLAAPVAKAVMEAVLGR
jgi:peptidoglycan glycosyltransferase